MTLIVPVQPTTRLETVFPRFRPEFRNTRSISRHSLSRSLINISGRSVSRLQLCKAAFPMDQLLKMDQLSAALHTALAPVLTNQPGDPLLHLMSHFREAACLPGSSPLSSAFRTLRLCSAADHHHCDGNIMQAWHILGAAGGDGVVAAEQFMQLVSMLLDAFTGHLQQRMQELLGPLTKLPPDFATFRAATKSCLLLEELTTHQPDRSPSDLAFGQAEARKLLTHLIQQRLWFKALEPLPDAGVSELSAAAAEAAAGRQQQQAAAEQQAAQIVELALAAVKTSGQD